MPVRCAIVGGSKIRAGSPGLQQAGRNICTGGAYGTSYDSVKTVAAREWVILVRRWNDRNLPASPTMPGGVPFSMRKRGTLPPGSLRVTMSHSTAVAGSSVGFEPWPSLPGFGPAILPSSRSVRSADDKDLFDAKLSIGTSRITSTDS
ncbi:hypothetical protein HG530_003025 [Fusarium avenaceum]|nr:hypothetical protein HG530_003025 [Fusarium avenaceum]